jgi:hypothetical protein
LLGRRAGAATQTPVPFLSSSIFTFIRPFDQFDNHTLLNYAGEGLVQFSFALRLADHYYLHTSTVSSPVLFLFSHPFLAMATKTLEARFEHLSVKDEKEDRTYAKHKVL